MRLTKFSDYALRVLLLAASQREKNITVEETAKAFDISHGHLKKVVRLLSNHGYLNAERGRSGGYHLAREPDQINLGQVLRLTEPDFSIVECYMPDNACGITPFCKLPVVLDEALRAFMAVFDAHTLADVQMNPGHFESLVAQDAPLTLRAAAG